MHPFLGPALLLYLAILLAYFWSLWKLYKIVCAERPEWLHYKGEPSIFYQGMPRMADPNVSLRVVGVAFSGKARLLTSPDAFGHAMAIRILLPAGLLLFGGVLAYILSNGAA